jgi:hypothetical protein
MPTKSKHITLLMTIGAFPLLQPNYSTRRTDFVLLLRQDNVVIFTGLTISSKISSFNMHIATFASLADPVWVCKVTNRALAVHTFVGESQVVP